MVGQIDTFSYKLESGDGSISVSTTRLETMLGDAAVAVHPEDERYRHLIGTSAASLQMTLAKNDILHLNASAKARR